MTRRLKPLHAALLLAAGLGLTPTAFAHGDVTPQAVDTKELPTLGAQWRLENPYRQNDKAVKIGSLMAQAGLSHRLFPDLATMASSSVALEPVDFDAVARRLAPRLETSRAFLRDQIAAAQARGLTV